MSAREWAALEDLRKDKTIVITKPDKSNGIVVLSRDRYVAKMEKLLADENTFQRLPADPTKSREESLNRYLLKLKNQNAITKATYDHIRARGSQYGVLYGLPKVHKQGCPLRPIIASCNTFNYKLAAHLVDIIRPISTNTHTVKDTFSFVDFISSYKHNNGVTCSFDVSSLFTNIPLQETINICADKLYSSSTPPSIPRDNFVKLLEFATKKSHFIFNGKFYDQVDGVAMGSPLAPVLANVFMAEFERKWIDQCSISSAPLLWLRYVDDTFAVFRDNAAIQSFYTYINNCHPSISFTIEIEQDNRLPFLDCCVHKTSSSFQTSLFRKKTFTGLYTLWDSFTPRKYKINLIRSLTYRTLKICSTNKFLHSCLEDLKSILLKNGYPLGVIKYNIGDVIKRQTHSTKEVVATVPRKQVLLCLPFLGEHSYKLRKNLKGTVQKLYKFVDLKVIFTNSNSLQSFFRYKDQPSASDSSKVVYKATCWDCDAAYIGMTTRRLRKRNAEHFAALSSSTSYSAIADHTTNLGHRIRWDHFEVLERGRSIKELKIKESLHMQNHTLMNGCEASIKLFLF